MKKIIVLAFGLFVLLFNISTAKAEEIKNNVTLVSSKTDNEWLKGFKYEIKNSEGLVVGTYNSDDIVEQTFELADGKYEIIELARPDGYEQVNSISLDLPHQVKDGVMTKQLTIYLKHKVTGLPIESPKTEPKVEEKPILTQIKEALPKTSAELKEMVKSDFGKAMILIIAILMFLTILKYFYEIIRKSRIEDIKRTWTLLTKNKME